MHRGYTKRWRKRWDKNYHKDYLLWILMDYFIDHANHKDTEIYFPNAGIVEIKRGQHIFGSKQLSEFFNTTRQQIRTRLELMKNINFLTIQTTNKYSIATICNYDLYNPNENNKQPAKKPMPNQQLTTPNNDNNVKNNIIKDIISFLNEKANTNFKPTTNKTRSLINARLNENFTLSDFKSVITKKCSDWIGTDMAKYLRPETLFGTKFEGYINENTPKKETEYEPAPR